MRFVYCALTSAIVVGGIGTSSAADLAAGTPAQAVAQSQDKTWTATFNSELRYFTWRNTFGSPVVTTPPNSGSGSQFYMPLSLGFVGNPNSDWKVELGLRGGYVSARQNTTGETGSVSTTTDTQATGTVTYNGINGIQPFVGLAVNIPTGKSALYGNARFARMDGDLVDIGSYGEGWNIGPSVGVNIALSPSLLATISGGYTRRGAFDKEGPDPITGAVTATDRVKNGDDTTLTFALGYSQGPLSLQGSVSEAWSGESQVNEFGMNNFQRYKAGVRTTITGMVSYAWNEQWTSSVNGFWSHTTRNQVLDATGLALIPEQFNQNNDIYKIANDLTYKTATGLSLGPTVSYLRRLHNSYDPQTFAFLPAKTRWSAGALASYNITNTVALNGRVERVWIHEDVLPGPPPLIPIVPAMSGDAWVFVLGGTATF